ncbi:hypothetical protein [Yoonia sp. R78084]|uniref:hypothetical protein n=1 Tax=Yoonia sp. R78084 TaxID=3093869 RepID=UPI0037DDD5CA
MAAVLAFAATPISAQGGPLPLPIEALLTLGERPDLDGAEFSQSLGSILSSTATDRVLPEMPFHDPYLWYFQHTLDVQSSDPTRIVECSRHGLATRAWFAENRKSGFKSVLLEAAIPSLPNDQHMWPEGAIAQLNCAFFFGEVDTAFSGLTEADARAVLSEFQTVSEPMEPELQTLIYGSDGYKVSGSGGKSSSSMQVAYAALIRIGNGQVFSFTNFLINPGS